LVTAAVLFSQGAEARPLKILAFGDSLIHGYGLPAGETFPEQLQRALSADGPPVVVINGGNSGDTSAAGLARLDWALVDKPDLVIVEFGANDMLRGLDPGKTYDNLDAILSRLAAKRLPVLLIGMVAPRNLGRDYAAQFNAVFPRLAEAHGVAFYPFFLDGVALNGSLNQRDGMHPNGRGVAVIVERLVPVLRPLLERVEGGTAGSGG
jgi:acyl-CoA thioesterase-1